MIKRPDLKDLKVGDTVYVLKNVNPTFACFRYRFISEETKNLLLIKVNILIAIHLLSQTKG